MAAAAEIIHVSKDNISTFRLPYKNPLLTMKCGTGLQA